MSTVVQKPPLCACGAPCAYYGPVGGYSVRCAACNAKSAARQRRARAKKREDMPDSYRRVGHLFVPETVTETQPIVLWFGQEMENLLALDKHKDGPVQWRSTDVFSLLKRLDEEVRHLKAALRENPTKVVKEAAALANSAMRVADWIEFRLTRLDIDHTT